MRPIVSVASLVGFGAVVASVPAFDGVRQFVLGIQGGPLVSLAVATLLSVCGVSHKEGYLDIVMAAIVSALIALVAVIVLGSLVGSF